MPGMNKIVLKNLFRKPATRKYPVEKRAPFENGRGRMVFARMENCIYCGLCQKNCPGKAITINKAKRTNTVDPLKCVQCGYCADACPKDVIDMVTEYYAPMYRKTSLSVVGPEKPEKAAAGAAAASDKNQPKPPPPAMPVEVESPVKTA
jgi:ech hydrogenase subunit F